MVGGICKGVFDVVGGWCDDMFVEDIDMIYCLLLSDWCMVYLNYVECYEEVLECWVVCVW